MPACQRVCAWYLWLLSLQHHCCNIGTAYPLQILFQSTWRKRSKGTDSYPGLSRRLKRCLSLDKRDCHWDCFVTCLSLQSDRWLCGDVVTRFIFIIYTCFAEELWGGWLLCRLLRRERKNIDVTTGDSGELECAITSLHLNITLQVNDAEMLFLAERLP